MRLVISLLVFALSSQAHDRNWHQGKIVDSEIDHETVTPGTVTTVVVRGPEYEYVAERQPSAYLQNRKGLVSGIILSSDHGCRFIVGDIAEYSVDKGKLYVIDADGKQCKLNIIREALAQPAAQVQPVGQPSSSERTTPPQDFDFRHLYWGMNRESVINTEGQSDKSDEKDLVYNERQVAGVTGKVAYHFRDGKLRGATVAIPSKIREKDAQQVFANWQATLEARYGKGGGKVENIAKHVFRASEMWATDRTQIALMAQVDGSKAIIGVDFTDKVWFDNRRVRDAF